MCSHVRQIVVQLLVAKFSIRAEPITIGETLWLGIISPTTQVPFAVLSLESKWIILCKHSSFYVHKWLNIWCDWKTRTRRRIITPQITQVGRKKEFLSSLCRQDARRCIDLFSVVYDNILRLVKGRCGLDFGALSEIVGLSTDLFLTFLLSAGELRFPRILSKKEMHNRIYVFKHIMSIVTSKSLQFATRFIWTTQFHRVTKI